MVEDERDLALDLCDVELVIHEEEEVDVVRLGIRRNERAKDDAAGKMSGRCRGGVHSFKPECHCFRCADPDPRRVNTSASVAW